VRANELELVEEGYEGFVSGIIQEIEFFGKTQMIYVKIKNHLTPVIVEAASEKNYKIGSSISIKFKSLTAIQSKRLSMEH
jgi:hypothetical protein